MPHSRKRYVADAVKRALAHSPTVGVLGHRQTGKTTLVSNLSKEYVTFDLASDLEKATHQPYDFFQNRTHPFGVDEAQLCPAIFPAVKEWIRTHPKKGQFIFSGSIRFTSRKMIRESLTGRIVNIELLPMTVSEIYEKPLSTFLSQIWDLKNERDVQAFKKQMSLKIASTFSAYLDTGGLPGICFFRDPAVRHTRFESHLDTILNRDLALILKTTLSSLQLRKVVRYISHHQGKPFELSDASKASGVSTITIKKLLNAFEGLFLIRNIPTEGTVSKTSYFVEDQGLATHLSKHYFTETDNIIRGVYANLRQEVHDKGRARYEISSFRTHDGTDIPLVFRGGKQTVGIIPSDEKNATLKGYASARSFLQHFPEAKVVIACKTSSIETRDFRTFVMPYWWLV